MMELLNFILLVPIALFVWIFIEIFREQKEPMDTSNRINKIRLVWFGFSRQHIFYDYMVYDVHSFSGKWRLKWDVLRNEDMFVGIPELWWLENDEYENMKLAKPQRQNIEEVK